MARKDIPVQRLALNEALALAPCVTTDAEDGLSFKNDGRTLLVAKMASAVTTGGVIRATDDNNGRGGDLPFTAGDDQEPVILGPFPVALFGRTVDVDVVDFSLDLVFYAVRTSDVADTIGLASVFVPDQDAVDGDAFTMSIEALNAPGTVTSALNADSDALPTGLTLSGTTISGTPSQQGDFDIIVDLTSGAQTTTTNTFTISVAAP